MRVVLASRSPRRRDLLENARVIVDVDPADVDESLRPGEPPAAYAERVAIEKAALVAPRHSGRVVVAADTIVLVDDRVLGKPAGPVDAVRMLEALSGRTHEVLTAVAVTVSPGGCESLIDRTAVTFRTLSSAEIAAYVATGEPLDKAGAYAIQGGAAGFVERVDGRVDTVVGLPVEPTLELVRRAPASGDATGPAD